MVFSYLFVYEIGERAKKIYSAHVMSNDIDEVTQLRSANEELKEKLERWKSQSKVGIEQHRNRIKELTVKWSAAEQRIEGLENVHQKLCVYWEGTADLLFASLDANSKECQEVFQERYHTHLSHVIRSAEKCVQENEMLRKNERKEKEEVVELLQDELRMADSELEELRTHNSYLNVQVELLGSQQDLKESAVVKEAVMSCTNEMRREYEAEITAIRMQLEAEMNALQLSHEIEISRLNEDAKYRMAMMAKQEAAHVPFRSSLDHSHHREALRADLVEAPPTQSSVPNESHSTTVGLSSSSGLVADHCNASAKRMNEEKVEKIHEEDDGYWTLFHSHENLEKEVQTLRKENQKLKEDAHVSQNHTRATQNRVKNKEEHLDSTNTTTANNTSTTDSLRFSSNLFSMESDSTISSSPSTLEEAHNTLRKFQAREASMMEKICDLQLQLGALKENPPIPKGALAPAQAQYLTDLIHKIYTHRMEREHLLHSLAPVLGEVLGVSKERIGRWMKY